MSASLRALLTGIVDYAGLFPPTKLDLEPALRNYAAYRKSGDRWMLGRFIIPAARLAELDPHEALFHDDPPFVFSVLGRSGKTGDEFLQGLTGDLADIASFRERHAGRIEADVLEMKLPEEVTRPENYQAACYALVRAAELIETSGPTTLTPFYEIALTGDWPSAVAVTLAALQYAARFEESRFQGAFQRYRTAGFKLRCGGLEASAFPSAEQVAHVIVACQDYGVALKCTAGLHHPVRRHDAGVATKMHGFLNVFGGAVLAAVHRLTDLQLRPIIEEEDPAAFTFDEFGFAWRDLRANDVDIRAARQRLAIAFGSCSFDEPRDDLRALGLLG
jgi:hypothetical protein